MRFPEDISYGASGGPNFSTEVIQVKSGAEKRQQNWSIPQYRYEVAHGIKNQEQLNEIIDFFYYAEGKANSFRFKDWADYEVFKEKSFISRPSTDTLKLYKKYSSFNRRIHKIVSGTLKLYADNVLVSSGYSLDIDTGIITLQNPSQYELSTQFTYECEFDVWVRFDTDTLMPSIDNYNVYSINQIPLVEDKVSI